MLTKIKGTSSSITEGEQRRIDGNRRKFKGAALGSWGGLHKMSSTLSVSWGDGSGAVRNHLLRGTGGKGEEGGLRGELQVWHSYYRKWDWITTRDSWRDCWAAGWLWGFNHNARAADATSQEVIRAAGSLIHGNVIGVNIQTELAIWDQQKFIRFLWCTGACIEFKGKEEGPWTRGARKCIKYKGFINV